MAGISATRNRRVRVLTVDDEPGLDDEPELLRRRLRYGWHGARGTGQGASDGPCGPVSTAPRLFRGGG